MVGGKHRWTIFEERNKSIFHILASKLYAQVDGMDVSGCRVWAVGRAAQALAEVEHDTPFIVLVDNGTARVQDAFGRSDGDGVYPRTEHSNLTDCDQ